MEKQIDWFCTPHRRKNNSFFTEKMEKQIDENETCPNLPEELIGEILSYLPLKHLFQLKCVSKSWRSLISSKSFAKDHVKRSNTCVDLARHKLMLSFDKSVRDIRSARKPNILGSCSLQNILYDPIISALDDNRMRSFGYDIEIRSIKIRGSCNGLILMVVNWSSLFLWNPFIGKMKKIPLGPIVGPFDWSLGYFIFGLGYDECRDDYKVVCINNVKPYDTHIYSCKANSWKQIENFDKGNFLLGNSGKFVNGRLHWLAAAAQSGDRDMPHWLATQHGSDREIVSLDLVKEKYGIVGRPENHSDRVRPILKDSGGYLSLISISNTLDDISGWVMMKYGVRESWTKIWTFSDFASPWKQINEVTTFCLKKNGDVTLGFGCNLLVVYSGKNELRRWRDEMLEAMIDYGVYVDSLVWPFGDE